MDVLSHGRVILGGGSGWLQEEFEVLHAPYRQRGDQTDEYLQVMKALWTQDQAQFEGRYEKFSDIVCAPKPVQQPHPPIWIGGHSKRALRRTATLGDGWYGHVFWRDPDGFAKDIVSIKQLAEQAGRDPDSLTYAALSYERSFEDVLAALPRYEAGGLNHVVLAFFAWTDQFDEVLRLMERFAGEVGLTSR
jgi:alkanesulfonate monooxygenase SsuD/methylene tetrahydromethanopterin reductase-like flavin-dependent oxidoreductase (luciferase family)